MTKYDVSIIGAGLGGLVKKGKHLEGTDKLNIKCTDEDRFDQIVFGNQKKECAYRLFLVAPKTKIPNFYFTGQNIDLHGVLGTTISAVLICSEILGLDYLLKKIVDYDN